MRKRQRTGALQKLAPSPSSRKIAKRLGVRQSPAAFTLAKPDSSRGSLAASEARAPSIAPEDWRTPKAGAQSQQPGNREASWSAAVPCRFHTGNADSSRGSLAGSPLRAPSKAPEDWRTPKADQLRSGLSSLQTPIVILKSASKERIPDRVYGLGRSKGVMFPDDVSKQVCAIRSGVVTAINPVAEPLFRIVTVQARGWAWS
jgi:hypothetical protein